MDGEFKEYTQFARDQIGGEFDRWLNEIRAEAWDEGWERSIDFERSWRFAVKNGETVPQRPRNPYRPTEK